MQIYLQDIFILNSKNCRNVSMVYEKSYNHLSIQNRRLSIQFHSMVNWMESDYSIAADTSVETWFFKKFILRTSFHFFIILSLSQMFNRRVQPILIHINSKSLKKEWFFGSQSYPIREYVEEQSVRLHRLFKWQRIVIERYNLASDYKVQGGIIAFLEIYCSSRVMPYGYMLGNGEYRL